MRKEAGLSCCGVPVRLRARRVAAAPAVIIAFRPEDDMGCGALGLVLHEQLVGAGVEMGAGESPCVCEFFSGVCDFFQAPARLLNPCLNARF